jgi:hypothetical protein
VYNILADVVVGTHFLFILFVVCGGLLVIRWPRMALVHLPAAIWGAAVEISPRVCPLTPLENYFRNLAGAGSYSGDFVVRYLIPVIYPENITITMQQFFGAIVIVINIVFYTIAIRKQHLVDKNN